MSFVSGPYVLQQIDTAHHGYEGWETFTIRSSPGNVCLAVVGEVDRFHDSKYCDTARLMAASPDLYAACNAADTAFAVLNVQDLGDQARACIREAWPMVQTAIAKVYPNGTYAEAIKEAHEHEIKRLDGVIAELIAACKGLTSAVRKALPYLPADEEAVYCGEWLDEANEVLTRVDHNPS